MITHESYMLSILHVITYFSALVIGFLKFLLRLYNKSVVCSLIFGTITVITGNINALKYFEIVDNFVWPVIARHIGRT